MHSAHKGWDKVDWALQPILEVVVISGLHQKGKMQDVVGCGL